LKDKADIKLHWDCRICRLRGCIYDLLSILKRDGDGFNIANLVCPNCQQNRLNYDLTRGKDKE